MARIRTIKPEFFRSRKLALCSIPARLTFQGLWVEADDFGRGIADPRLIKGAVWPLDDDMTWKHVAKHLDELEERGRIRRYVVDGETYYEIPSWEEHQAAAYRRGPAVHPEPPEHDPHADACRKVQDAPDACKSVLELGTGNIELGAVCADDADASRSPKRRGKTACPDPFVPDDVMVARVESELATVNWVRETEKFVAWARANDRRYARWDQAWWNWMLRAAEGAYR